MDYTYINRLNISKGQIIKKLYAVIVMLLIASILLSMVSFAWMSIARAPEIVGVNTTVGSNGNLEIALNTHEMDAVALTGKEDQPVGITDAYDRNPYWGNVVDLSDERYGLQQIQLKPAVLNLVSGTPQSIHTDSPIRIAQYSLDGRIQMIDAASSVAAYDSKVEMFVDLSNYGVRAAGIQGIMDSSVDDVYAVSVDLLFRTNAVNAKLLLQTVAIDRIYNKDNAPGDWEYRDEWEAVQGSGSNITIENKKLQDAIRVAFVDTLTGEVYGIAAPNGAGDLYMIADTETAEIMPLVQNEVTAISIWIYLDGNVVENLHADTSAATEMKVNLQFSTDVELEAAFGDSHEQPSDSADSKPELPTADEVFYVTDEGDGEYAIYTLNRAGSRDYEVQFSGTMDEVEKTVIIEKVTESQNGGIAIPSLSVNKSDGVQYAVSINPDAPFAELSEDEIHIAFVPVEDTKVRVVGSSLQDLFDVKNRSVFRTIDMQGLNTGGITNMYELFYKCSNLTELNLSGVDTSSVTDMCHMFCNCYSLTELDLSSFDTSRVTTMAGMFNDCDGLTQIDVSGFMTTNVISMEGMFSECDKLTKLDLSGFDTSSVTIMRYMFEECCSLLELDLSGFDTSSVITMTQMFSGCSNLTKLNLSNFDTTKVISMGAMFSGCSSLTELDVCSFDTTNTASMTRMFANCSGLTELDVSNFNTANVTDMSIMFYSCSGLSTLDVSSFSTVNVTDMGLMFCNCRGLTKLDVSGFDTANVTDMSWMFCGCTSLTALDVGGFDTAQVTDMSNMFSSCSGLPRLDVSNFNTANVTDMNAMFYGCTGLTSLDLSNFNTINVIYMEMMFWECNNLMELDISSFDTRSVTSMCGMFSECCSLETVDVSGFNTSVVNDMSGMFRNCTALKTLNVSGFNTVAVTSMNAMFYGCKSLQVLDVKSWNTTYVNDMSYMFAECTALTTLVTGAYWNTENANTTDMYKNTLINQ